MFAVLFAGFIRCISNRFSRFSVVYSSCYKGRLIRDDAIRNGREMKEVRV